MYSQGNTKFIQQQRQIRFKVSKPEMFQITKENSLLLSRKKNA